MNRQNIILGDYTYIIDQYIANKDYDGQYNKFVVIRNTNFTNNIACDDAIYFIEKDIIEECTVDDKLDMNLLSKKIAYPAPSKSLTSFYTNFQEFNKDFEEETFNIGNNIELLYDKNYNEANILCDKFKLYLPSVNAKLNAIICIYSIINNIKFYFLCRPSNQYSVHSDNILTINNETFCEYIELYIPNIEFLLSKHNIYLIENYNINEIKEEYNYLNNDYNVKLVTKILPEFIDSTVENDYTVENVLLINVVSNKCNNIFYIADETKTNVIQLYTNVEKICIKKENLANDSQTLNYVKDYIIDNNNTKSILFNVIEYTDEYYIYLSYISMDDFVLNYGDLDIEILEITDNNKNYFNFEFKLTQEFTLDFKELYFNINGTLYKINLLSSLFYDFNIVELNTIVTPFTVERVQDNNYNIEYKKVYNGVSLNIYNNVNTNTTLLLYPYSEINTQLKQYILDDDKNVNSDVFINDIKFGLKSNFVFNNGCLFIESTFNYPNTAYNVWDAYAGYYNVNKTTYQLFKDNLNELDDEIDIGIETNVDVIGYRIEISNNKFFNKLLYTSEENLILDNDDNIPLIDNFQFDLHSIFTSWDNIPQLLVVRTCFIDKLNMNVIYSNPLVITDEYYKYIINEHNFSRVTSIVNRQASPNLKNNIYNNKMDFKYFNFIDKVNCVVVKNDENKINISSVSNTPKVLYKPIFYKTTELQNIKIKSGLTQNIGINLSDLLTKVETFKLVINNKQYIEIGRNDIFVIFNIDATQLGGKSGVYVITNQNDEYISDGNWITY